MAYERKEQKKVIGERLSKVSGEYFWLGIAVALLRGLILGGLTDYDLGSDDITIVPLDQGINT